MMPVNTTVSDAVSDSFSQTLAHSLILIVDDTPANVQVVGTLLRAGGFRTAVAMSGGEALSTLETLAPDLILLDIAMPDMTGIEVCERLKAQERTRHIPIIFLTALTEKADLLRGFEVGAVDYVTKPFDVQELTARVRAHLEIKHSRELLAAQNRRLAELNREKDEFLGIASHDMKNPLTAVQGLSELMLMQKEMPPHQVQRLAKVIFNSAIQLNELINNLLDINRIEMQGLKPNLTSIDIVECVRAVQNDYTDRATAKDIMLHFAADKERCSLQSDAFFMRQVIENLVSNAVKYSPKGKNVYIEVTESESDRIRIAVRDEGPGLSAEDKKKLFGKFARLSARPTAEESSTGLGLSIVKKIVESLGGKVWCESELGAGATFLLEFPLTLTTPA